MDAILTAARRWWWGWWFPPGLETLPPDAGLSAAFLQSVWCGADYTGPPWCTIPSTDPFPGLKDSFSLRRKSDQCSHGRQAHCAREEAAQPGSGKSLTRPPSISPTLWPAGQTLQCSLTSGTIAWTVFHYLKSPYWPHSAKPSPSAICSGSCNHLNEGSLPASHLQAHVLWFCCVSPFMFLWRITSQSHVFVAEIRHLPMLKRNRKFLDVVAHLPSSFNGTAMQGELRYNHPGRLVLVQSSLDPLISLWIGA